MRRSADSKEAPPFSKTDQAFRSLAVYFNCQIPGELIPYVCSSWLEAALSITYACGAWKAGLIIFLFWMVLGGEVILIAGGRSIMK